MNSKTPMSELARRIADGSALVGVVGLGYVGLPLAVAFAEAGLHVLGFDVQQKRVDLVRQGQSYIGDVASDRLSAVVANGRLCATTDQGRLEEPDAICVCVPTPLTKTKDPDLSFVERESEEISRRLRPGQLVVLESTTYPGTTRELMLPILEGSGLKAGHDFYLAFSPERVDPGTKHYTIRNTPKLVGGLDAASTKLAASLYRHVAESVVTLSSPETAEMTKVFENVFRAVNIALVNELARLCGVMGVSVWEVIDAAATKPFGYMPFYPGPGVGGHCIPLDPYYLTNKAREYDFHIRFIELAADINEGMPHYVVARIADALNEHGKALKGATVLVLGAAYKPDVEDLRESPSLKLIELLRRTGARVSYHDPHIRELNVDGTALHSVELNDNTLRAADCVVIATDHSSYDMEGIVGQAKLVYDARGATRNMNAPNVVRLGG